MKSTQKNTIGEQLWQELNKNIFEYYPKPLEKISKAPELLTAVIQEGYFDPKPKKYTLLRHIAAALTLERYRKLKNNLPQILAHNVKTIYGEPKQPEKLKKLKRIYKKTTLATNVNEFKKSILKIYFN